MKKEVWKKIFPKEQKYFETENGILYNGDALKVLKHFPSESIDCVITSPPYWAQRDYGVEGQIGLETDFNRYIEKLVTVFEEVYRILKPTGTVWVNIDDTYFSKTKGSGGTSSQKVQIKGKSNFQAFKPVSIAVNYPEKSLCLIPFRFALAMINRGWILRNVIIWHKPNAMPESVTDRFTNDFEYIFFFVKRKRYYFKQIKEPNKDKYEGRRGKVIRRTKLQSSMRTEGYQDYYGKGRNKRAVWSINTKPFKEAHFAVFPPEIPQTCIEAGCPEDGIVLDPFMGAGTTAFIAEQMNRKWVGIELNPEYCEITKRRLQSVQMRLL